MWRLLRHPVAAAAVRAAACVSVALLAARAAEGESVSARVLEVGEDDRITAGDPATVRVEISTGARLSGTFQARLARPREGRPHEEVFGMPSAAVRFLLEAGETRVLSAYLPDVTERSCDGALLRWTVDADDGLRVAEGVQPLVCLRPQFPRLRVLHLTEERLPSRRSPAAAHDEAQSYSGYGVCGVSGRDFVTLREEQREALLDWTALGGVLVLTAPLAPPGHGIDARIAAREALTWRDADGRQLREVRLHLGFVRAIDLPLGEVAMDSAVRSPLYRLVTSGAVEPALDDRAFRDLPLADRWDPLRPADGPARMGFAAGAAALLVVSIVGTALWWSSRPRAAAPAVAIGAFAALLAVAPALIYVAASEVPTGNADACWDLVLHDPDGGPQSRWTQATLGGGGGRADPLLSFPAGPGVAWRAARYAEADDSVRTELGTDGRVRVGVERRSLGFDRLLVVRRAEATPNDPAWDAENIAPRGDGLAGVLRARRAFTRVGVVGPLGAAWLGSVRQGERIDLSRLPRAERLARLDRSSDRLDRVALNLVRGQFFDGRSLARAAAFYAIATEAAPCSVAVTEGGSPGPPCTVHVQLLAGGSEEKASWLPAEREVGKLYVHVPAALWDRMSAEGRSLRPEVSYLDAAPPTVSPSASSGFLDVTFRVGGAPPITPPGEGGVVLARWRLAESVRRVP